MAGDLVNAVGEGINNALALTGSPSLLKIPAPGTSADTNEGSVFGSPDKLVDLNAFGDGIFNSLSALNPFSTDQGNKQAGTDGENSRPQTPLGRWTKLTPKSLTDGFKFTPLKPSSSKADNQTGGPLAKSGPTSATRSSKSVRMWKRPSKKGPPDTSVGRAVVRGVVGCC